MRAAIKIMATIFFLNIDRLFCKFFFWGKRGGTSGDGSERGEFGIAH